MDQAVDYEECHRAGYTGSGWETKAVSIASERYASAISCYLYGDSTTGYMEFVVPQGTHWLTGTVGITDDSADTDYVVEFYFESFDGVELTSPVRAQYFKPQSVEIDVSNAQRIRIGLRVAAGSGSDSYAAWADFKFSSERG